MDILIMSLTEASARAQLMSDFAGGRWQNPKRMDAIIEDLKGAPYFVADKDHTITIDHEHEGR